MSGVSGRYASALFALALERRETATVAEALARFESMIAESADLRRLVRSPVFSADEQVKALGPLLEAADVPGSPRISSASSPPSADCSPFAK